MQYCMSRADVSRNDMSRANVSRNDMSRADVSRNDMMVVDVEDDRPRKVRRAVGMVSPVAYDPSPSTLTTNVLLLVLLLMFLCMIVLIIVLCRLGELQKSADFIIQQTMAMHGTG